MPIYTVEIDGKTYDLEGDHQPTESEARAAIGGRAPVAAKSPGILDRAVDALPAIGATVGGITGGIGGSAFGVGIGGIPGAVGGAALGGAGGESAKQLINRMRGNSAPDSMAEAATDIGREGLTQGAYEAAGGVAGKALQLGGRAAYKGAVALLPRTIKQEFPRMAQAGVREGIVMSRRGGEKAGRLVAESGKDARAVLAKSPGVISMDDALGGIPALKDTIRKGALGANDPALAELDDLVFAAKSRNASPASTGWPISNVAGNELKGAEQDVAQKVYRALDRGAIPQATTRAEFAQDVAKSTRKALERNAPDVAPINSRTQELLGLERAASHAGETGHILSRLGGVGAGALAGSAAGLGPAILAALAGATLTTPAGLSRLGVGMSRTGGPAGQRSMSALLRALMSSHGPED